ncbi:MAG: hypothetical protein WD513_02390 [Balneolaceae bacterium]
MAYTEEDEEKFKIYEQVHLRSKQELSTVEKITLLNKKLRNKLIHLVLNVAIVVLFIYMYLNGYTTFADWFYYILFGIFALNMLLIHFQRKQITALIDYMRDREIRS